MFGDRDEARWRDDKVVLGGGERRKVHGAPQNEAARGSARAALGQVSRPGDLDLLLSSASTQDKPSSPAPVARCANSSEVGETARVLVPYRSSWPGRRSPGAGADDAPPLSEDDAAPLSEGVLDAALSRRDAALSRRDAAPALSWRDAAPRWRVLIVLGLGAASGLCISSVMGILQGEKDNRRVIEVQRSDCRNVRDKITDWGKRLAVEASTSGWLMVRERDLAVGPKMPFLVPGVLSAALAAERLERMAEQFEKVPPTVVWCVASSARVFGMVERWNSSA